MVTLENLLMCDRGEVEAYIREEFEDDPRVDHFEYCGLNTMDDLVDSLSGDIYDMDVMGIFIKYAGRICPKIIMSPDDLYIFRYDNYDENKPINDAWNVWIGYGRCALTHAKSEKYIRGVKNNKDKEKKTVVYPGLNATFEGDILDSIMTMNESDKIPEPKEEENYRDIFGGINLDELVQICSKEPNEIFKAWDESEVFSDSCSIDTRINCFIYYHTNPGDVIQYNWNGLEFMTKTSRALDDELYQNLDLYAIFINDNGTLIPYIVITKEFTHLFTMPISDFSDAVTVTVVGDDITIERSESEEKIWPTR